jgi:predicted NAD/FAD-dependent oxidoreductase
MGGFVPRQDTRVLEFAEGTLAGLRVEVREISTGGMLGLMAVIEKDATVETIQETVRVVAGAIIGWNVQADDGTPVVPSEEALLDLPMASLTELCLAWFQSVSGTIPAASPLGSRSPSTGPSAGEEPELPMEPL